MCVTARCLREAGAVSADAPTALVTGASSGIGKGFAERFARNGHDVVLVARRVERLRALAESLERRFGVSAAVVPADLADPAAPGALAAHLREVGLEIGILVNCAGFGTAGRFVDEDADRILEEMTVDVVAPALLTRHLLPSLLAAGPAGALITVSSTAGHQPVPNLAVYAACKAFVTSLTSAIWEESRGSGLRVLALCPGPTATEFFEASGSEQFKVGRLGTVEEAVDAAFAALDTTSGPVVTVGLGNRIQAFAARCAPRRLVLTVGARSTTRAGSGPREKDGRPC